ncbi:asparagine synthase B [Pseudobutyrivibrio ruminis]|uniref:asparagine synthase B n=1 Tax=Pseudobutyrivibrio ruminis TaxID=46206 RepID=UPI000414F37C|nr:asparagine synthase B [Pseudobutyrivibrio ruminis]
MCSIMALSKCHVEMKDFEEAFSKTLSRGPDMQKVITVNDSVLGFQRLSIMGLTEDGMQPFELEGNYVICNGELYGFKPVREELKAEGYKFKSDSDCEIILPMYRKYGCQMFSKLDAEFAMVIYDKDLDDLVAARDPIGIRPLFYGYDSEGSIMFASEAKNLVGLTDKVMPFPPGHYYYKGVFTCYRDLAKRKPYSEDSLDEASAKIKEKLIAGIEKRLDADAPVGFLLSGGLDSSLVCAVAQKFMDKPIKTFAIGMNEDAIDLKYAKEVAEYIGSEHHEIIIDKDLVIESLEEVVASLGTYDITTIRASMGMYLICKGIKKKFPEIRVLLTGEISDEIFGYKYTDFAPNEEEFQREAEKRLRELYMYDVLRADRCISVHSMEARVPFGDLDFVDYVMSINPKLKMNRYNKGKYLLRHAFENDDYLPYDILFREKAAFSDAVGHSMVYYLKEYANSIYSDEDLENAKRKYEFRAPFTKESLLYRELFEKYYPGQAHMVVDFWMPNKNWPGCNVDDPSARVLANYGDSGV